MRKYNLTQAKIYVYDKASGKMVEKPKPEPIEGDVPSGENDEAKRGESLELSADNKEGVTGRVGLSCPGAIGPRK